MKLRKPNNSVRTLGTAIAAAALMTGGANAFAEPVSLELEFTCPFPLIGEQPIRAQISADVPTQATVGDPTPEFTVDALTTVNEDSRLGLKLVGSTTIEGTATNETTVVTPNREIDLTVPLAIPQSPIPDETGEFTVPAQGTSPAITFNEDDVGEAVISIGGLTLDMIARVDSGDIAPAPIGEFTSVCVQNAGQNNILQTLQVVPDEQFEPRIAVSPESIDFGNVQAGTTAEEVVTISNTGQAELGINNVSLGGTDAAAFTQTNSCTTVAAGESCEVSITYAPDGEGDQNAVLSIESGDTENPVVDVPLTGTSVLAPIPEIVVTPEDVSFGTVMLGETASAEVTISNEGNETLMINAVEVGGSDSSDFMQTNDCTTVAPEESCTVQVSFTPSATGGRSASLNIASDDPETPDVSVPLSGQGSDGSGETLEVLLDLAGQTDITASGSSLPLSGSIATQLELATGMFEADLALDPTQGQFKIPLLFKSLTANAKVEFEQADITTGTLINGNLTASSSLYVEVPKVTVRLFGLRVPVGGGPNCRTNEPVNIELASVEGTNFSLSEGGEVTGNYDLPALENCGPLTDVLNQFLAGPDNGIDLTLTPNL